MMTTIDIEELALKLPEADRAALAEKLLRSLPPVLDDDDDGVAEALRRNAEMDANPEIGITLEEFRKHVQERLRS
jgi:putative addiction module component (TIGR02574 family)